MSKPETGAESTPATNAPKRKIALLGSAPSSVHLAPYDDPSWEIWGCSPASIDHAKRISMWFELHPLSDASVSPDYLRWLAHIDRPVALIATDARVPKGFEYPREAMLAEYGPYFFTSSVAWMLALAIREKPAEIGLWGIDMSANEEYALQRPGCHFFIREALKSGIKVFVPSESDVAVPPALYGYVSGWPMYRKLQAQRADCVKARDEAAAQYEFFRMKHAGYSGAVENIDYMLRTWVHE